MIDRLAGCRRLATLGDWVRMSLSALAVHLTELGT